MIFGKLCVNHEGHPQHSKVDCSILIYGTLVIYDCLPIAVEINVPSRNLFV